VLADTNVLSELVRPHPAPSVVAWATQHPRPAISVISIEELRFGAILKGGKHFTSWLSQLKTEAEILPVTEPIAETAARLRASRRLAGRPVTQADMLIAATALEHGLPLATRNVRDFEGLGLKLVNPFHAAAHRAR
jgi:predicted nucleic acid-binding protein